MPNDVHVLHVMRTLGCYGGMERNVHRIVIELAGRGIKSSIALLSDTPHVMDYGDYAKIHRVDAPTKDRTIILRLRNLIQELRPNVVHARNWATWPDAAFARIGCFPRPPLVFSFHGLEYGHIPLKKRLAFRTCARLTTRMFAVSGGARAFLEEKYGVNGDKIGVIHNGVDTARFEPRPPKPKNGRFAIAGMGRLSPSNVKNFPLLLRSAARLVGEGLDVEVRIAGGGPEAVSLRAIAKELGIDDRVHLLDYIEDVPSFLADIDVFVLSSDIDAMPNALLEAMAAGRACVATRVGGVPEIIGEGEAGIIVPPRDESAMTQSIGALLRDDDRRHRVGENARKRILDVFDTQKMYDRYEQLYREVAR